MMNEEIFVKGCKGQNSEDILNWYRNLYFHENDDTEKKIMADAVNDILPRYIAQKEKIENLKQELDICKAFHKEALAELNFYKYKK